MYLDHFTVNYEQELKLKPRLHEEHQGSVPSHGGDVKVRVRWDADFPEIPPNASIIAVVYV